MSKYLTCICCIAVTLFFPVSRISAQTSQTVGLFTHLTGSEDDGYVLFPPQTSDTTYLINKCGELVHSWAGDYTPGLDAYFFSDGSLLRAGNYPNPVFDAIGGSFGGVIERFNWDGSLEWHYVISDTLETQNHDIWPMPNGDVLIAVWEVISDSQAIANGRNPTLLGTSLWSAKVVEIKPVGTDSAEVVWQWRAWDHLVQDYDSTKPNFGVVANHPELLNLNYLNTVAAVPTDPDWLHLNQVTYNPTLDQVMLSSHNLNEIWIVDHSTNIAASAGHTGGVHNKGGDFLYRWGNPAVYKKGAPGSNKLWLQHDPEWITYGKYAGQISIFNNGLGRPGGNASSVDIIEPPIDSSGNYTIGPSGIYGPDSAIWSYEATTRSDFFSAYEGSAQVIPNGNILVCEALKGRFFEIDTSKNILWDYVCPVNNGAAVAQGTAVSNNPTYRCYFYPSVFAGFSGRSLVPSAPIEANPLPVTCALDDVGSPEQDHVVHLFPNPAYSELTVEASYIITAISIDNFLGQQVYSASCSSRAVEVSVADLPAGMYIITINATDVRKFVKE